ncbi:MAG TPA: M23 family metallopeptidase [Terracidiphilus sp.]|nr:M23 family metallopeptidase [Terracidiphilus sp.]
MRLLIFPVTVYFCSVFVLAQPTIQAAAQNAPPGGKSVTANAAPFPPQLELRVPFEPTAFPNGKHLYLAYEIHLTNYFPFPLSLRRIEVLDRAAQHGKPVAVIEGDQLEKILQPLSGEPSDPQKRLVIGGGQTTLAYMWIELDRGSRIPVSLVHRVSVDFGDVEGAVIATRHTQLRVLGPPLEGADWIADDGPSNDEDNHHRRGVAILDGRAVDSRRYAIDWMQVRDGASYSGDARDVHSYYCYGEPVLAVADGRVVTARDGLPENTPGHGDAFHPAIPITLDTIAGNTITLDIGGGQFAYYLHLLPGSLRVKVGDRVRRGQVLARVGASGDAREPHLHFEVTDSTKALAGDGLPYLIDRYRQQTASRPSVLHIDELPLDHNIVTFGENRSAQ